MSSTNHSRQSSAPNSIAYGLAPWLILVALLAFYLPLSLGRLVAGDEGYYLLASQLVSQGQRPYLDFFYPQAPLLPYIYGTAMALLGSTWDVGRTLSGIFGAGIGLLIFLHCRDRWNSWWALAATAIFAVSGMAFPWFGLIKSYAASTFFLLAAYVLTYRTYSTWLRLPYFLGGISIVLAAGCRSYLIVAAVLPLALILLQNGTRQEKLSRCAWYACGGILAALPILYFIWADFELFLYNNLGYHTSRSSYSFNRQWRTKSGIALRLLGLRDSNQLQNVQFAMLLWGSLLSSGLLWLRTRRIDSALVMAAILLIVSMAPTPVYLQYFCVMTPFLAISVTDGARQLHALSTSRALKLVFATALVLTAYLYARPVGKDYKRFTQTGRGVIGVSSPRAAVSWRLATMRAVARAVNKVAMPGEQVLSPWPGYLVGTHAVPVPHVENDFARRAAAKMKVHESSRYKILSSVALYQLVESRAIRVLVLKPEGKSAWSAAKLAALGYRRAESVGKIGVYVRAP